MEITQQTCKKCDRVLGSDARACICGALTPLASFKERVDHELSQWRAHKTQVRAQVN